MRLGTTGAANVSDSTLRLPEVLLPVGCGDLSWVARHAAEIVRRVKKTLLLAMTAISHSVRQLSADLATLRAALRANHARSPAGGKTGTDQARGRSRSNPTGAARFGAPPGSFGAAMSDRGAVTSSRAGSTPDFGAGETPVRAPTTSDTASASHTVERAATDESSGRG